MVVSAFSPSAGETDGRILEAHWKASLGELRFGESNCSWNPVHGLYMHDLYTHTLYTCDVHIHDLYTCGLYT